MSKDTPDTIWIAAPSRRQFIYVTAFWSLLLVLGCESETRIAEARARAAEARARRDTAVAGIATAGIAAVLIGMYFLYLRSLPRDSESIAATATGSSVDRAAPRFFFETIGTMVITWLLIPSCLLAPIAVAIRSLESGNPYAPYYRNSIFAGVVGSAIIVLLRRTSRPKRDDVERWRWLLVGGGMVVGLGASLLVQHYHLGIPAAAAMTMLSIVALDWYFSTDPRKLTITLGFLSVIAGAAFGYLF